MGDTTNPSLRGVQAGLEEEGGGGDVNKSIPKSVESTGTGRAGNGEEVCTGKECSATWDFSETTSLVHSGVGVIVDGSEPRASLFLDCGEREEVKNAPLGGRQSVGGCPESFCATISPEDRYSEPSAEDISPLLLAVQPPSSSLL